jgi:hypothetical protein
MPGRLRATGSSRSPRRSRTCSGPASTLGLGPTVWTDFGTQLELYQQQGEGGSSALLIFRIAFHATRI